MSVFTVWLILTTLDTEDKKPVKWTSSSSGSSVSGSFWCSVGQRVVFTSHLRPRGASFMPSLSGRRPEVVSPLQPEL